MLIAYLFLFKEYRLCGFVTMKNNMFNLLSSKSITKDDEYAEIPTNFPGFFVMLKRKFWNISNLNLVYTLCNLPVFFLLFAITHYLDKAVYTISSPMQVSFFLHYSRRREL